MSKHRRQPSSSPEPRYDTRRLVVRGVRRKEPDWDTFIAVLLAHALSKTGADLEPDEGGDD